MTWNAVGFREREEVDNGGTPRPVRGKSGGKLGGEEIVRRMMCWVEEITVGFVNDEGDVVGESEFCERRDQ